MKNIKKQQNCIFLPANGLLVKIYMVKIYNRSENFEQYKTLNRKNLIRKNSCEVFLGGGGGGCAAIIRGTESLRKIFSGTESLKG